MAINKISGNILQDNLVRGSNLAIQGNLVYFDITNNRVGVATNTPADTFTVAGTSNTSNIRITSSTSNGVFYSDANKLAVTSANLTFSGTVLSVVGNVNATNLSVSSSVTVTGNIQGGNLRTTGQVSATGNITGGNVITVGLLQATTLSATGNVIANNASITNVVTAASITATGNVQAGNLRTTGTVSSTGNITGGNIVTSNLVSAANIIVSSLLANSVVYTDANDRLSTTSNLTFEGSNLALTGSARVDNITLDGTAISSNANLTISTGTNGNLIVAPNGTGTFQINSTTAFVMPVGNTLQRPGISQTGMLRFNTTTGQVEVYDGTTWETVGSDLVQLSSQTITGDNVTTTFTLDETATDTSILVSTNGVVQQPGVAYSVAGNQITFVEAPLSTDVIDVRFIAQLLSVNSIINGPGNAEVTTSGSGNVILIASNGSSVNVTGNFLPSANVTYDIGSPTLRWRDGYFSGNTLVLGNVVIKNPSGNSVAFFGPDGSTPAPVSLGNTVSDSLTVGNIFNNNANGIGNIGNSSTYFNTVFAKATSAQYADLAERFISDQEYEPGTVLIFGGPNQVTLSSQYADPRAAGIVSTDPAYLMNAGASGISVVLAVAGQVPCWVIGPVSKGDVLTTSSTPGHASRLDPADWAPGAIIGKSLEDCGPGAHKIMVFARS